MRGVKRLFFFGGLAVAFAVAAFDTPFLGIIIAPTSGNRSQGTTNTPFVIPPGQCVTVDCATDAGVPANAFMAWSNTFADAGGVTPTNWARNTSYWETCAGATYNVLSIQGNTDVVYCHVTSTGTP